jgi:hypothetical protein
VQDFFFSQKLDRLEIHFHSTSGSRFPFAADSWHNCCYRSFSITAKILLNH